MTVLAVAAMPAMADAATGGGTGGVSAGGSSKSRATPTPKGTKKASTAHTAPVTSRSPSLVYNGPVYEKTATGQIVPYQTPQSTGELKVLTGGSPVGILADTRPELLVPGHLARVVDGFAAAPMLAPASIQQIVWAGNQIVGLPYIFGGGHASFSSPGYDCSGTVSFALHGELNEA